MKPHANGQTQPADARRPGHPLLGERQVSPEPGAQFLCTMSRTAAGLLGGDAGHDRWLMPFAGFVGMALAAARAGGMSGDVTVARLSVETPLAFDGDERRHVHTALVPAAAGGMTLAVRSAPIDPANPVPQWERHATAVLLPGPARDANACPPFAVAGAPGLGDSIAVADVAVPPAASAEAAGPIHQSMLAAALRLAGALLADMRPAEAGDDFVPVSLGEMTLTATQLPAPAAALRVVACVTGAARVDLRLETPEGVVVALLNDLVMRPLPANAPAVAPSRLAVRWQHAGAMAAGSPPLGRLVLLGDAATRDFVRHLAAGLRAEGATCGLLEDGSAGSTHAAALIAALDGEPGTVVD
jgi:hypothetical protein